MLLLRPARLGSAFALDGDRVPPGGFVLATVLQLDAPAEATGIVSLFEEAIAPTVAATGGSILAYFVTESSENTFPSLPVREGEEVFVWFAGFADRDGLERASRLSADHGHVLRLEPTSRSRLHGCMNTTSEEQR